MHRFNVHLNNGDDIFVSAAFDPAKVTRDEAIKRLQIALRRRHGQVVEGLRIQGFICCD
ncbi:MAG: hypothetical protein AAF526_09450 [Pseudomonadota bacterium]